MQPKLILGLSVGAGLLAVFLVQVQLNSERGETVALFRATETVAAGQSLGHRLEEVTLPGEKLFPNLLKEAPTVEMRQYVASAPLKETVHAGQVVLYRHLETLADPGVPHQIPPGKRAIAIAVNASSSVAYLIEPEDWVDVLAALPIDDAEHSSSMDLGGLRGKISDEIGVDPAILDQFLPKQAAELATQTLFEAVQVLAVGHRYRRSEPGEAGGRYETVTLLLSEEQSEELAHVRDVVGSRITLVLRRPEDIEEVAAVKVVRTDSLGSGS